MNFLRFRHFFFLLVLVLFWRLDSHYFRFMPYYLHSMVFVLHRRWFLRLGLGKVDLALALLKSLFFFLYGSVRHLLRSGLFLKPCILLFDESAYVTTGKDFALSKAILKELLNCNSRFVRELIQKQFVCEFNKPVVIFCLEVKT